MTGHDPEQIGTYSLRAQWLTHDRSCTLPAGALLLAADQIKTHPRHWSITLYRAGCRGEGHLETLRTWERRGPVGRREVAYTVHRLAPDAARHRASDRERVNARPGRCLQCGLQVAAMAGVLRREGERWLVEHVESCPQRPSVLESNVYGGRCLYCDRWVAPESDQAVLVDDRPVAPGQVAPRRYRAAHHLPCPPSALPGPPNAHADWCHGCGHRVETEADYRQGRATHHAPGDCRPPLPGTAWTVRHRGRHVPSPGTVVRVRFAPRSGEPAVPAGAPGARVLDRTGYANLIARPATYPESAPLLAEDLGHSLSAHPQTSSFKMSIEALLSAADHTPKGHKYGAGEETAAAASHITTAAQALFQQLSTLDEGTRIDTINTLRQLLHAHSPLRDQPVDCVLRLLAEQIRDNDYNPNTVARPEMELLEHSIRSDGYTQPIVTWVVGAEADSTPRHEVVDGFHRHLVGTTTTVREAVRGRLPVTVVNKAGTHRADRQASTIRHNRARGLHTVQGMSDIVVELSQAGKSDEWIARELGLEPDEVTRLRQVTGIAAVFADEEFSTAWAPDDRDPWKP